ncbi:MAG TPA: hypothetical protein VEK08_27120 [Planctomycetota bacterium]|nr:hypothetical protein [Planctomycetota bacterium]
MRQTRRVARVNTPLKRMCLVALLFSLLIVRDSHAILLTAIKFDHKKEGGDKNPDDGLALRKNFKTELKHKPNGEGSGEWVSDPLHELDPSINLDVRERNDPALYVVNKVCKIKVRLRTIFPGIYTSAIVYATPKGTKLPAVKRKRVTFDAKGISVGDDGYVDFELATHFSDKISKESDSWDWHFEKVNDDEFFPFNPIHFGSSGPHTIYTVEQVPNLPWYDGKDTTRPWTEALDFAFNNVGLGQDPFENLQTVPKKLTDFFHTYGLKYDVKLGAVTTYVTAKEHFDLTGFMMKSKPLVICVDTAVSLR